MEHSSTIRGYVHGTVDDLPVCDACGDDALTVVVVNSTEDLAEEAMYMTGQDTGPLAEICLTCYRRFIDDEHDAVRVAP